MARQGRRRSREEESIQRGTDHRHPEGIGGGSGDGRAVPTAWHRAGCFYRWKGKYGGMEVSEAKRLRQLEEENHQLKHTVAELLLDKRALQAVVAKKW
jgi:hypothetical protein